jgi:hypothetical protein
MNISNNDHSCVDAWCDTEAINKYYMLIKIGRYVVRMKL